MLFHSEYSPGRDEGNLEVEALIAPAGRGDLPHLVLVTNGDVQADEVLLDARLTRHVDRFRECGVFVFLAIFLVEEGRIMAEDLRPSDILGLDWDRVPTVGEEALIIRLADRFSSLLLDHSHDLTLRGARQLSLQTVAYLNNVVPQGCLTVRVHGRKSLDVAGKLPTEKLDTIADFERYPFQVVVQPSVGAADEITHLRNKVVSFRIVDNELLLLIPHRVVANVNKRDKAGDVIGMAVGQKDPFDGERPIPQDRTRPLAGVKEDTVGAVVDPARIKGFRIDQ